MKVRTGFVSNSSSMSFIADLNTYDNVFALAKRMLEIKIMIHGYGEEFDDSVELSEDSQRYIESNRRLITILEEREEFGMDPNTPVTIPTTNFDSWIERQEDGYYCDSCNNHAWWQDLEGSSSVFDECGEFVDYDQYFYDPMYDAMVKRLAWSMPWEQRRCDKMGHYYKIMLEDGEIVCPACEPEKVEQFKMEYKLTHRDDEGDIIDRLGVE